MENAEKALATEKLAHQETNDILKQSVKECFDEALAQLWVLNPEVKLNVDGYDYHAFVDEGDKRHWPHWLGPLVICDLIQDQDWRPGCTSTCDS